MSVQNRDFKVILLCTNHKKAAFVIMTFVTNTPPDSIITRNLQKGFLLILVINNIVLSFFAIRKQHGLKIITDLHKNVTFGAVIDVGYGF
jgi:hypothetical protein